jgi:hypothetical protein
MVGRTSGVGKILQKKLQQPDITIWHCINLYSEEDKDMQFQNTTF